MAYYESAASEYDEVNEIRQYYFQSAASPILRRSFRDRDEFAPTLMTTYVVQFLAFSSILACAHTPANRQKTYFWVMAVLDIKKYIYIAWLLAAFRYNI